MKLERVQKNEYTEWMNHMKPLLPDWQMLAHANVHLCYADIYPVWISWNGSEEYVKLSMNPNVCPMGKWTIIDVAILIGRI